MKKDKRFLTGLGFGLIAGAILLQLMNVATSGDMVMPESENSNESRQYTVSELTDIADQLGYRIYKRDEKRYTEGEAGELVRAAIEQDREREQQPATPEQPAEKQSYVFTIKSGMSSDQVAEALVNAKLIDDGDAFKKELARRELTNKIQVGDFTFEKKPSLAELIDKITKQ